MDSPTVLVIGATGHVGGHAVAALHRNGHAVRAMSRHPSPDRFPPGVEVVTGDVCDQPALAAASDGATSAFLVFPTLQADHAAADIIESLSKNVDRLVYLSAEGVTAEQAGEPGILGSHARVEELIRASDLAWTFLRSGGMATNTLGWADQIRAEGTVRWAYADAARSLVHEADLGEIAAHVLTTPGHDHATYEITGPEVLTQAEQAHTIGRALGLEVDFREISREEMRAQMVEQWGMATGAADEMLDAWASMVGNREGVTDTVERLLGRPATPLAQWARDHAVDFRPVAQPLSS